jgi:hypothetical protein
LFQLLEHPYAAVNCLAEGSDREAPYRADPGLVIEAVKALEERRSAA